MKYFMKKIEKMLKSENDDVALQNRILGALEIGVKLMFLWYNERAKKG